MLSKSRTTKYTHVQVLIHLFTIRAIKFFNTSEVGPCLWANGASLKIIYKYTQINTILQYGQPLKTTRTRVWVCSRSNTSS